MISQSRAALMLSGEDPILIEQVPEVAWLRDIAFLVKLLGQGRMLPLSKRVGDAPQPLVWRAAEDGKSLTVCGLHQGPNVPLDCGNNLLLQAMKLNN